MTVGTSAVPRATIASISASSRPVPCSMQSMPASIRPGSTAAPKQWAVTLAPCSWAAAMAAANVSARERRGEVALLAGDPVAHELDPAVARARPRARPRRPARRARPRRRSCGCSAWCGPGAGRSGSGAAGRRAPGSTACRPASRRRGSAARRRRGPASACASDSSSGTAPWSSRPMWQWASTSPGTIQPSATVSAPGLRLEGDPPVDDVEVAHLTVREHRAAEPQGGRHVPERISSGRRARPASLGG